MQRSRFAMSLVLVLGIALRLILAWSRPADLLSDNDGYLSHAKPVAAGEGFHGPYTGVPTAFRPPGYPIVLGILIASGLPDSAAVLFIGMASSAVMVLLTRTLAIQYGLDPRWSLLAVLGVALDPLLLRYSVLPMTEVPCAAILLAAVVAYTKSLNPQNPNERSSHIPGITAGLFFGIGTLIRPVVLIVCIFMTASTIFSRLLLRRSNSESSTSVPTSGIAGAEISAVVPMLVMGIVLCPWIVRNAVRFHHFVPATTHGGYTLALGNNPDFYRDVINGSDEFPWDGPALDAWQKRMIQQCADEGTNLASEPAVDAWYYTQAKTAIRSDPVSFLNATTLRLRRFWAISTAESTSNRSAAMPLVRIWYVTLWGGMTLQFFYACFGRKPSQQRSMSVLWLTILAFLVMHSVYWTDTRMRAPVMPIMIVISVSGWQTVSAIFFDRWFQRRSRIPSPETAG